MKHRPPTRAPAVARGRHTQKMASWVEAGPGRRLTVEIASSKSLAGIQPRSSTQSLRSKAMCAGGPPKPVTPMRPQHRAIGEQPDALGHPRSSRTAAGRPVTVRETARSTCSRCVAAGTAARRPGCSPLEAARDAPEQRAQLSPSNGPTEAHVGWNVGESAPKAFSTSCRAFES